jgi:DNA-directed RNA polymerase beta' subunit
LICLKGDNKIISPYYYQVFIGAIGKNVSPDIVNARYIVNKDGERIPVTKDDFDSELSSPYAYIGIDAFYDKYEEILEYFKSIKTKKASTFDRLLKEKRNVFVSHIPIMSNILRPQSITADTFYFNTIDKLINTLYTLSTNLQNCEEVERDYILQRIQEKVNGIWDIAFETLNKKTGLIRGELLGGSINYSSRNVICPDPTLHDDEVSYVNGSL